ncbi:hypothetical protein GA0070563_101424 [Micromonospora carbonacea]|uniref:Uncharacterized protein n=1 Tax=Micromonospora carbonacea TaxID=47853 RepID=A0A1C4UD02_9ACTN|nr:hypothetical protein GA0070563_101424 [Micromonospora carbonacea]
MHELCRTHGLRMIRRGFGLMACLTLLSENA